MDSRKYNFLVSILGEDGARALQKASERSPELENAILPRAIMAWIGLAALNDFEGQIPGNADSYCQFTKSEDKYSGSVAVEDQVYSFEQANIMHLGACVAVALGADHEKVSPRLRDVDIQRLGKNVDCLVKARAVVKELSKRIMGPAALEDAAKMSKAAKSPNAGKEAPGPAHAPTAPLQPLAPTPPDPTQDAKGPTVGLKPKAPKPPAPSHPSLLPGAMAGPGRIPNLKVTKAQSEAECSLCGRKQFKAGKFTGCLCLSDLRKSVTVTLVDDGYNLSFGRDWNEDSLLTLLESLGEK